MAKSVLGAGLFAAIFVLSGCTRTVYQSAEGLRADGLYDTPVSEVGADDAFERAFHAIHFVNTVAFYRRWIFPPGSGLSVDDLADLDPESRAARVEMYHQTASGTGTVVHRTPDRVALVTSAHVVSFPDSVVTFVDGDVPDRPVRSLALRVRQMIYVPDIPGADRMEILALDDERDVVLLGQVIPGLPPGSVPVLDFPVGTVDDLQWGSRVYVFGFPSGTRMMTSGLVSKTQRDRRALFLTDAAFNRGFSGGMVLAVRDGPPNFEWVGIATSSAASTEFTLAPPDTVTIRPEDLDHTYEGPIVIHRKKRLRYGITSCTSVDAVMEFLREHADSLGRRGYFLDIVP